MSKLPAIQFYPGDWKKDPGVQALSFHDRGVWFEILLLMHESEERGKLLLNGSPMPEAALARLMGLDNQILTTTITTLLTYGVASRCETTGALVCRRMVRDEKIRNIRKTAGYLGGNPILLKQKSTTMVKQKSTPSSSSSSSIKIPDWIPKQDWDDWVAQRKRKPTQRATELAIRKLEELKNQGHDPAKVLQHCIMNGYQGLFPPKGEQNGTHIGSAKKGYGENRDPRPHHERITGYKVL